MPVTFEADRQARAAGAQSSATETVKGVPRDACSGVSPGRWQRSRGLVQPQRRALPGEPRKAGAACTRVFSERARCVSVQTVGRDSAAEAIVEKRGNIEDDVWAVGTDLVPCGRTIAQAALGVTYPHESCQIRAPRSAR